MTTFEFLADLRRRNVRVWVDGGALRCSAPRGALTSELQSAIAERKAEILAVLRSAQIEESSSAPRRVSRDEELPLSFAQERLWFLHQLAPENTAYNIVTTVSFRKALNRLALQASLDELARRHEILRTTLVTREGRPVVRIHPPSTIPISVSDLQAFDEGAQRVEATRLKEQEANLPFDLERGPLMRVSVIQFAPERWELIVAQHHIITDRWSIAILVRELSALYNGHAAGSSISAAAPDIQYVDFAKWQRDRLSGGLLEEQLGYWRKVLAGDPPTIDLPVDRPRPVEQSYRGAWENRVLSTEISAGVRRMTGRASVTPFMIFMAAFNALLSRYTGHEDILVGSPIAGRSAPFAESLLGCFLNMLVMRTDLSGNPSFETLVGRVRESALGAYAHADIPFELLVADLRPHRDLSRSPFFQVSLALQSATKSAQMSEDVAMAASSGALFDLTLFIVEGKESFTVTAEYSVDLFDAATISRLLGHFETLLAAGLANPDMPVGALPLLTAGEERTLLHDWNDTASAGTSAECVTALVEAQAAAVPDAPAVSSAGVTWSYAQLNRRANQLAHFLRELGAGPETLVGVCLERSADVVVALLGILKSGAAYVPLDPSFPKERLAFMMRDAGISLLVSETDLEHLGTECARVVCLDAEWPEIANCLDTNPAPAAFGEALAYVMYTSGSTGIPKGVQVRRRALVNFLETMRDKPGFSGRDVLASVTTIAFDISGLEIYLPLICGGHVVVVSRETASDGVELATALAELSATVLQATPATWRLLIEAGWQPPPGFRILCGGEALPSDLAGQLAARAETWNLYGPTETTIWSSRECVNADPSSVTIGRPIANTDMYVLDRMLRPVPAGIVGELFIGGDGLARGYLGRRALTSEKFVPHPFSSRPGARLYRTGDLAKFLNDGRLEWVARIDHQVKIRGHRIELGEIEAVIGAHESVKQVVVFPAGSGDERRLVSYVVLNPGVPLTVSELRRVAKERLPAYMVPSFFLQLSQIPLTANGKVDRRALPDPFAAGRPEISRVSPSTDSERRLAAIWQQVLGGTASIGAHDNFFDIGGHSLLSMRVIAEIQNVFGKRLNPRVMFRETLAQIAARCDRERAADRVGKSEDLMGASAVAGPAL